MGGPVSVLLEALEGVLIMVGVTSCVALACLFLTT